MIFVDNMHSAALKYSQYGGGGGDDVRPMMEGLFPICHSRTALVRLRRFSITVGWSAGRSDEGAAQSTNGEHARLHLVSGVSLVSVRQMARRSDVSVDRYRACA